MKLTKNFSLSEFDSKCGAKMPESVQMNVLELARNLQVLRDELGTSIRVNSGYRSPAHNKKIGGASKSTHLLGLAADIVVNGKTPKEVAETIERLINDGRMKQGGLKAYNTFVHYDHRNVKARW